MSGYLSLEGLQHFWSKVKNYVDNKFNAASNKEENITYSTEEHIVGTWIDGRPVYEKTYRITVGSSFQDYKFIDFRLDTFPSASFDIDNIVSASGSVKASSRQHSEGDTFTYDRLITIGSDGFDVMVTNYYSNYYLNVTMSRRYWEEYLPTFQNAELVCTVRYTKLTDK